jgi:putative hydrolase of the HAD superfamily
MKRYTTLFFDLDDTLYAPEKGVWHNIRARIDQYMRNHLGFSAGEAARLRREYFETYGTTLRGLQANFQVETDDFLLYVHDLPLEEYLLPDPGLQRVLKSLPQTLWIFTNADERHARRVLEILGINSYFTGIIDVRATEFHSKPHPRAYQLAFEIAGVTNPSECVLFDDADRNLAPAKELGCLTVRVGPGETPLYGDISMPSLHNLPEFLPALWTRQN